MASAHPVLTWDLYSKRTGSNNALVVVLGKPKFLLKQTRRRKLRLKCTEVQQLAEVHEFVRRRHKSFQGGFILVIFSVTDDLCDIDFL
eukprot:CAMPEP_0185814856 /NCGR_PEP_ID=MMETSP1322-20130828/14687_1 /TAXON_ID=265543 /ORGANISM="Minutocellus polymorphus, Strain RCC2270" /LENGTH=87 /DNA_ID=CAMNT_0028511679 /DNA_START=480 /DNA_END=743 /DNA_ORIENTATION=+